MTTMDMHLGRLGRTPGNPYRVRSVGFRIVAVVWVLVTLAAVIL